MFDIISNLWVKIYLYKYRTLPFLKYKVYTYYILINFIGELTRMQLAPGGLTGGTKNIKVNWQKRIISLLLIFAFVFGLVSCGEKENGEDPNAPDRDNTPVVLTTEHPGTNVFSEGNAKIDYSNVSKGYIMAQYTGSNKKVKLQLLFGDDDEAYNYDLSTDGTWEAFPLSAGSGDYAVGIFENLSGEQYSQVLKESISANIENEFEPFLHPNQYVNYTDKTKAIALSEEICAGAKSDLGAVEKIYEYAKKNIDYDDAKAKSVQPGYLPVIDETLETGKGICFDYASLMTAMLRAQRIPCKLVIGYAGTAYHAWISVYLEDQGWVDNAIEIHNNDWTLMDPTFAANGDDSDPNVVGDGENYLPYYYY